MPVVAPDPVALLSVVMALVAQMHEAMQDDVLAHALGQVVLRDAHDRHVGRL